MKIEFEFCAETVAVSTLCGMIGLTALYFAFPDHSIWPKASSDWAGWVQAVGSIAAIALGVWAVRHQLDVQRADAVQRETAAERARLKRAFQMFAGRIFHGKMLLQAISWNISGSRPDWLLIVNTVDSICNEYSRIATEEVPTDSSAILLNGLRSHFELVRQGLHQTARKNDIEPDSPELPKLLAASRDRVAEIVSANEIVLEWALGKLSAMLSESELKEFMEAISVTANAELRPGTPMDSRL